MKLFRVVVSTHRTDYIVTNDLSQESTEATQEVCGFRWKIEQFHREGKQVTGLEHCQCRKARIQRNHIGCAFWCGSGSKNWRPKQVTRSINSNMACWMITSLSNSRTLLSRWFLRKSYEYKVSGYV